MQRMAIFASWMIFTGLPVAGISAATATLEYDAALRSTPNHGNGEKLFSTCAACHGSAGNGAADGSVPAIGGQHFLVLVRQLVDFRHDKRWDPRMAQFSAKFHLQNAQAIADVAAYVSRLDPTWVANARSEDTAHGAQLYERLCSSCHGRDAEGNERRGVPRLRGQHHEYLVRQMHDVLEERRSNLSRNHERLLEPFDRTDILGIAGYLASLGP